MQSNAVTGSPKLILHIEGAVALAAAVIAYRMLGGSWGMFALLFLAPDLGMAAYLAGPRWGARGYNLLHTYAAPGLLALAGRLAGLPALYPLAAIWAAHIGFDRMLGYGLKYPEAFGATHLGAKGRAR